jgi:hypothetical protein
MKSIFLFSLLILIFLMASCGNIAQDSKAAEAVAKDYFESIRAKDFDKAITFYAPQFFEKTTREEWLQSLKNINERLGGLDKYDLVSWKIQANAGTPNSGTFYILEYKIIYTKYQSAETLTLFRPTSGGEIKILGHSIQSPGVLK